MHKIKRERDQVGCDAYQRWADRGSRVKTVGLLTSAGKHNSLEVTKKQLMDNK